MRTPPSPAGEHRRRTRILVRYGLAVGLTGVALLARFALAPQLGHQPFATFFIAVVLTAFLAGPGPTLMAVVLGYLAADWFFIEPLHAFGPHSDADLVRLGAYLAVCGVVIVGSTRISRARDRAEVGRAELEREMAERRRAEEALRTSEQRFRALVTATSDVVYRMSPDWSEMRELRSQKFIAPTDSPSTDWMQRYIHPHDQPLVRAAIDEAIRTSSAFQLEHRVRRVDGTFGWTFSRAVPLKNETGDAIMEWFGVATDVTKRKLAEEALREADRRKDEFLGVLSHELRNPLAPIRNSVHVLGRADPASEQAERARTIIARQVDHLARLVDDLLDVKRISTGKLRLHKATMDLVQQVRETVEDLRPLFVNRSLSLDLDVPNEAVWVNGDRTRLAQVVTNLLHNAAKFTDAGGHVAVTVARSDGQARIRVRDDGAGVPPEMLEKLFQAFVQSDRTLHRTRGGLGLGLSLARGIAELHGGAVSARSEGPGTGTEFVVTLPTTEPAIAANEPAVPAGSTARCRVLIIEDNADSAESLRDVLAMLGGHEVYVALDGAQGITAARQHVPDVILCDIGLPVLDGYEVARRMREGVAPTARLVALSGYASAEDIDRALRSGFDYHVAKPPDIERVLALVADAPSCTRCEPVPENIRTGHNELDAQHAAMLTHWARLRSATKESVWELLRFLQQHTASHLQYEEAVMEDLDYPDLAVHKERHEDFLRQVRLLHEQLERDGATPTNLSVMVDTVGAWIADHVLEQDRRLAEFIRSRAPERGAGTGTGSTSRGNPLRLV